MRRRARLTWCPENERAGDEHRLRERTVSSATSNDAADGVARHGVSGDLHVEVRGLGLPHNRHQRGVGAVPDGVRRDAQEQASRLAQSRRQVPLQRGIQDEGRWHRQAAGVRIPPVARGSIRRLGAAHSLQDTPIGIVRQPREVTAIQGERLRLGPVSGLLALAGHELHEQAAHGRRAHRVEHVDQLAREPRVGGRRVEHWRCDLRQERLPRRRRRGTRRLCPPRA